ncbi:MAG: diguanylate cyclase [Spirochaetes bacterium]|nr:diguanylate cyclase [Spirochaetota bacterium]MBU0955539.1 diguanylate cyclase [Spirochaetota bacterium]
MTTTNLDTLTGLPKREALEKALDQLMENGDTGCLTLVLCDVDKFLEINQAHGHAGGDAVLKLVAKALQTAGDSLAIRYGGDEFAVIFKGVEREQAFLRMEKIRAELAEIKQIEADGKQQALRFSISAGISAWPIDGSNQAELMRKADAALYRAKLGGRNKIMLAYEEKMVPKTAHFTATQLERLSDLAKDQGVGEAVLLREALDELLTKYVHGFQRTGMPTAG